MEKQQNERRWLSGTPSGLTKICIPPVFFWYLAQHVIPKRSNEFANSHIPYSILIESGLGRLAFYYLVCFNELPSGCESAHMLHYFPTSPSRALYGMRFVDSWKIWMVLYCGQEGTTRKCSVNHWHILAVSLCMRVPTPLYVESKYVCLIRVLLRVPSTTTLAKEPAGRNGSTTVYRGIVYALCHSNTRANIFIGISQSVPNTTLLT